MLTASASWRHQLATDGGVDAAAGDALTPIEQEDLPEGELDAALARIAWPEPVVGCALSQEILILPPSAQDGLPANATAATVAAHPDRHEARLVVGVMRDAGVKRAILGGCSVGSGIAIMLGLEHPELFEAIVLVGGNAGASARYQSRVEGYRKNLKDFHIEHLRAILVQRRHQLGIVVAEGVDRDPCTEIEISLPILGEKVGPFATNECDIRPVVGGEHGRKHGILLFGGQ